MDDTTEPKQEIGAHALKEIIETSVKKYITDPNMVIEVSIWSEEELQTLKEKLKAKL